MSYSTLTHRAGGRAFLQFRTSPLKPWLGWIVSIILAGFAATFSGISRLHLVYFSVVFSFKFDFYSEIKCVQSRADEYCRVVAVKGWLSEDVAASWKCGCEMEMWRLREDEVASWMCFGKHECVGCVCRGVVALWTGWLSWDVATGTCEWVEMWWLSGDVVAKYTVGVGIYHR